MTKYTLPSGNAWITCDSSPAYIAATFNSMMPATNRKLKKALFESLKQNLLMANKLAEPRDPLSL